MNITPNGEITWDPKTGLYTVWEETYANTVGTTNDLEVAYVALQLYAAIYLDF